MPSLRATLLLLPFFASCGASPTVLNLLSSGDAALTAEHPPSGWTATAFADHDWPRGTTPAVVGSSGSLSLRQRFDVGADAAAWTTVSFAVDGADRSRAWLNGAPLVTGASVPLPPGILRPGGNLLAVEATAAPGARITTSLSGAPSAAATLHLTLGPWLQRSADAVQVVFESSAAAPARVLCDGRAFPAGAGTHHVAQLSGLAPSHAYPYRVELDGAIRDQSELTTSPRPGEPVSFVVWGDHRTGGDEHRRGAVAVLDETPDFIVDTGDLVDTSTTEEWRNFFAAEYALLARVPLYPALGNHEVDSGGAARFAELFPSTHQSATYSFDAGAVHVAILDSNADLAPQATWLDDDLTRATAHGATALFIAIHHGLASSGSSAGHGGNDAVVEHIAPVARAHQVLVVLAGHDHFYERGTLDGLRYVVSGGGGAPMSPADRMSSSEVLIPAHHHVLIRVVGSSVTLRAVATDGTVLDEATLR